MRRTVLIGTLLLLVACGPEGVNDASLDPVANRLAWDLHGTWALTVGGSCSGGSGGLAIGSTLAWVDDTNQTAGATGSGTWECGAESGTFSIAVTTQGLVSLVLYRNGQPATAAWSGRGAYAPKAMAGRLDGVDQPWSASR